MTKRHHKVRPPFKRSRLSNKSSNRLFDLGAMFLPVFSCSVILFSAHNGQKDRTQLYISAIMSIENIDFSEKIKKFLH